MIKHSLTVPHKYMDKATGEEKTAWKNVGDLVLFPANGEKKERSVIRLNHMPGIDIVGFPPKPKETTNVPVATVASEPKPAPSVDVNAAPEFPDTGY